jgi:hypothetical protein
MSFGNSASTSPLLIPKPMTITHAHNLSLAKPSLCLCLSLVTPPQAPPPSTHTQEPNKCINFIKLYTTKGRTMAFGNSASTSPLLIAKPPMQGGFLAFFKGWEDLVNANTTAGAEAQVKGLPAAAAAAGGDAPLIFLCQYTAHILPPVLGFVVGLRSIRTLYAGLQDDHQCRGASFQVRSSG